MLYYDRIDVSGGIAIDTASTSKECDISHYLSLINKALKF